MFLEDKIGDRFAVFKLLYVASKSLEGLFFEALLINLLADLSQHCQLVQVVGLM